MEFFSLVPTAESPTLTHDEELESSAAVQKVVNGRVPLIAGVGYQ